MTFQIPIPFYEKTDIASLLLLTVLSSLGVSLWFITAGTFHISSFPPDSFYYMSKLPFTYWWGLGSTMLLLWFGRSVSGRFRTILELSTLFLLSLYLLGLPSFGYEDPRILDSFQHTGNSIGLMNNVGWFRAPIWYLRQFPGAFTFFAQLVSVAGIDPFLMAKFYTLGLSWTMILFIYVIARTLTSNYAVLASALFLSGIWFQLHISPQSLELVPYLGLLFVLLKLVTDRAREKKWALIAVAAVPSFVASHPETPLIVLLAGTLFLIITVPRSKTMFRELLPTGGLFLLGLLAMFTLWWGTVASETRRFVVNTVLLRALSDLSRLASKSTNLPSTPDYSYRIAITLEQGIAISVWTMGLFLLLFIRRYRTRESLLASFFLAGISTIPVALFSKADVLQRSYLFALIPTALLAVSLIERNSVLENKGRSLASAMKVVLVLGVVIFSLVMPLTRYGVDPWEYAPHSSLYASELVAGLKDNSVLFLNPGEYGWRFYAALNGDIYGPKLEQSDISSKAGGFTKPGSVLGDFNLTFTAADGTANYIVISNYYENLWILRFGSHAVEFLGPKANFELDTALGASAAPFNLVYSTGTDRVYANRDLG